MNYLFNEDLVFEFKIIIVLQIISFLLIDMSIFIRRIN
jgi:hypothetical protein